MKLKPHPPVLVNVFVDGRYEIVAPAYVKSRRDAFKIAMIKTLIPNVLDSMPGPVAPDQYEARLSEFKLRGTSYVVDLIPVK